MWQVILDYLTSNQKTVIGIVVATVEMVVIVVNMWRKTRADIAKVATMAADQPAKNPSLTRTFLWSVIPWNIVRKP